MDFDQQYVDTLISLHGRGREAAIPLLQGIQQKYRYVPIAAMDYVCEQTEITPSQIYGVATFYAQFRLEPVGEHIIKVCKGTACHVSGAQGLTEALAEVLGVADEKTTADGRFTLTSVACLGCCSLAPVIMIGEDTYGKLNRTKVADVITKEFGVKKEEG